MIPLMIPPVSFQIFPNTLTTGPSLSVRSITSYL
jgi:hypothetical protein